MWREEIQTVENVNVCFLNRKKACNFTVIETHMQRIAFTTWRKCSNCLSRLTQISINAIVVYRRRCLQDQVVSLFAQQHSISTNNGATKLIVAHIIQRRQSSSQLLSIVWITFPPICQLCAVCSCNLFFLFGVTQTSLVFMVLYNRSLPRGHRRITLHSSKTELFLLVVLTQHLDDIHIPAHCYHSLCSR